MEATLRRLLNSGLGSAAAGAAAALLLAGGGYAMASGGGTITVCVHKHSGGLYVGHCARHDRALRWNKVGPQGPPGQSGQSGQPGAPGSALAYAHVYEDSSTQTMMLDTSATKNFVSISPATQSDEWCLTPAPGINPHTHPAVVSPRIYTYNSNLFMRVDTTDGSPGSDCPVGHPVYVVQADYANGGAVKVDYNIVVP